MKGGEVWPTGSDFCISGSTIPFLRLADASIAEREARRNLRADWRGGEMGVRLRTVATPERGEGVCPAERDLTPVSPNSKRSTIQRSRVEGRALPKKRVATREYLMRRLPSRAEGMPKMRRTCLGPTAPQSRGPIPRSGRSVGLVASTTHVATSKRARSS